MKPLISGAVIGTVIAILAIIIMGIVFVGLTYGIAQVLVWIF